jgi:hypothetical protein
MDLGERLQAFKDKGWRYDPETGNIFSHTGLVITGKSDGYVCCNIRIDDGFCGVKGHQLAWYLYYGEIPILIDHIDGNKSNNKITNLRLSNTQKNSFNHFICKGYSYENGKYRARIKINGKLIHLGTYESSDEARRAYLDAKRI